jgi:hypothetical protein
MGGYLKMARTRNAFFSKENVSSPAGIAVIYLLASLVLIGAFRFVFPKDGSLIKIFWLPARLGWGVLDYAALFPALVMSALSMPFGLRKKDAREDDPTMTRFSTRFLQSIRGPLFITIFSAAIYGLLLFIVCPLVQNYVSNITFQSRFWRENDKRTRESIAAGKWTEAAGSFALCERVWPENPENSELSEKIAAGLDAANLGSRLQREANREAAQSGFLGNAGSPLFADLSGKRTPVDAAAALRFAEEAYAEERFYDAHWLANLAVRLSRPGAAEIAGASRLASQAWEAIGSLEPNSAEREVYSIYRLKRDGYEAMLGGEWIRAYYIFRQLVIRTPLDVDVANFFSASTQGLLSVAFFSRDIQNDGAGITDGALFSLPWAGGGRLVLRAASIASYDDVCWITGLEVAAFGNDTRPQFRARAPYGKIMPMTIGLDEASGSEERVLLLMRALDREDEKQRWEPEWVFYDRNGEETRDSAAFRNEQAGAELIFNISYDDFLMALDAGRGTDAFFLRDLFTAANDLGNYGYISEVFQAEIVRRVAEPLAFLPLAVLALIIGWRFRLRSAGRNRARYVFIPMFVILPLVYNAIVQIFRYLINAMSIWSVLFFGFIQAMILTAGVVALLFIISMIILAAQHE